MNSLLPTNRGLQISDHIFHWKNKENLINLANFHAPTSANLEIIE